MTADVVHLTAAADVAAIRRNVRAAVAAAERLKPELVEGTDAHSLSLMTRVIAYSLRNMASGRRAVS